MASNIQNTGISTSAPSTGGTRSNVVRVFDIVLDANHPIFDVRGGNIPYDPTLIGMIFYGDKDLDVTSTSTFSLPVALPKIRGKYPVINELVKIETGPSPDIYTDIGGNNSFNYVYYGEVVPVHGNAVHNALPSQKDLASTTPTSEESVLASNGTPNQSQPNEVSLDNTGNYQAKDNVRNLQPYAGDIIREGRAGQTIRMGTTNKEGANNWSDGDTFGDPVMIMRVGQSENQQGSTVVEDVNGDASSIYMFANQKLNNIQLTTTNFESCQATYTTATVPTVQLAVAPPPPEQTIPEEPTTPVDINDPTPAVESVQPQVTSSFSEDELVDPVFAALAEAEEEDILEIKESEYDISEGEDITPDISSNNNDVVIPDSTETFEENVQYSQIPPGTIYSKGDAPLGTKGITLLTCIKSTTAKDRGIQNYPGKDSPGIEASTIMVNLDNVVSNVIDPLLDIYSGLSITSGLRVNELNSAVTGSSKSEHRLGRALDIQVSGIPTYQIFNYIVNNNIPYNQLIWEFPERGSKSWIHVSYLEGRNNFNRTIASKDQKLKRALEKQYPGKIKFNGTYARYIKIDNVPDSNILI